MSESSAADENSASAVTTVDPTTSSTTAEPSTTTGTDSTTTEPPGTTEGDGSSTTGSGACAELDEPNDDEASALALGNVACAAEVIVLSSIADGATSPDWFSYFGMHDEAACGTNGLPVVTVTMGSPLAICAFASCPGGGAVVDGCVTGAPANAPSGLPGCCGTDVVALDVNCPPTDESATVLVEVATTDAACVPYELWLEY